MHCRKRKSPTCSKLEPIPAFIITGLTSSPANELFFCLLFFLHNRANSFSGL